MRVASLTINTYKSFTKKTTIELTPTVNIFIGPNNCGKTNILDAILYLIGADENPQRLHDPHASLSMNLTFSATDVLRPSGGSHTIIRAEAQGSTIQYCAEPRNEQVTSAELQLFVKPKIRSLHYRDFSDYARIHTDYETLRTKYPHQFEEFTRQLHRHFPEITSLNRIVDVEEVRASGERTTLTLNRVGGGFRRILVMLLYAFHPEYPIVLIDEPEIHLHPSMIKRIMKVFASPKTNQIIATTHSPLFVQAHTLTHMFRVLRDEQSSNVYYLHRNTTTINAARLEQELNSDNLEMFFSDKVLLVEGVSDRILMRGLIDRFYTGTHDIKVIYAHGKSNIEIYIHLMRHFHIPYLVILDRDALYTSHEFFDTIYAGEKRPHFRHEHGSAALLAALREKHILILDNGTIENNYPRKYQIKDSKPLNALYAATHVTDEEFRSPGMQRLRLIIESL